MKKTIFLIGLFFLLLIHISYSFNQNFKIANHFIFKDSNLFQSNNFITIADAEKVIEKKSFLKDSSFKSSGGVIRYKLKFRPTYIDSTSKGELFFEYQQWQNEDITKVMYQNFEKEHKKMGYVEDLKNIGDEAYLMKDNFKNPFILVRKNNTFFKIQVSSINTDSSLKELINLTKKIVAIH